MGQETNLKASIITGIISSVLATQITETSESVSTQDENIQISYKSSDCTNIIVEKNSTFSRASSSIFNDQETTQTAHNKITNQLTAEQVQNLKGMNLFDKDQKEELKATIANIVENNLTSKQLIDSEITGGSLNSTVQACVFSDGGKNYYVGTKRQIYDFYYKSYQTNKTIQDVSTLISNAMDLAQSQTRAGVLSSLISAIAMVLIVIVIVVVIAIVVYLITISKF